MNQGTIDEAGMLLLNNQHREQTSELDGTKLHALVAQGFHVGVRNAGRDAFLIAFDQDAISASPNFQWFKSRYKRFVYIDRVIVAPHQRGLGLARGLYDEVFVAAAQAGHWLVGCEVNVEPPNPVSDAFHDALGFAEVGRAVLLGGGQGGALPGEGCLRLPGRPKSPFVWPAFAGRARLEAHHRVRQCATLHSQAPLRPVDAIFILNLPP